MATNSKWQKNVVEVSIMCAQELWYSDNFFCIFFFADPVKGARKIYRNLKFGGMAIVTVWKEFGFKSLLWEVQRRVEPLNQLTELPLMEPWIDGKLLKKRWREVGLLMLR